MITTSDFCKKEYGEKLYKISFDAGFSCPNRDKTLGQGGCIFCSQGGSGDFAVRVNDDVLSDPALLEASIANAKSRVAGKFKGDKYIAYFQAFTNTYADLNTLKKVYLPIASREDISVISIATRPDCISEEVFGFLEELNRIKPVWVELGLQTVSEESIKYIRRGYETSVYDNAVKRLNSIGIHTITHVILFLPGETKEDMLNTVKHVVSAGSKGIKLQLLQVLKGTDLARDYEKKPFYIPTLDEYADMVKSCLMVLPEDMVVHRLTGDPPKKLLIAPLWAADKKRVINRISGIFSFFSDTTD